MPEMTFAYGVATVEFAHRPLRRSGDRSASRPQVRERDSAASAYVYGKGLLTRRVYPLTVPVDDTELAALRSFVETTVDGVRHPFTWNDHDSTARTVRLESPSLRHRRIGPDRHIAELTLIEQEAL
jgi:hypothetical protein